MQVATDTRLWLLNKLVEVRASLADLIRASVARAEQDVDVLMPGFTHLQPAMTVRWSHWLLGHTAAWQRDDMRLRDLMPRVAMLPLGSGRPEGLAKTSCSSTNGESDFRFETTPSGVRPEVSDSHAMRGQTTHA